MLVQKVHVSDLSYLKSILDSIEFFTPEIPGLMISDFPNNPESEKLWFTAEQNDRPAANRFYAPEKLTNGTYNLYAIGVRVDIQEKRIGSQMMGYLEKELMTKEHRILIVDT